MPLTIAARYLKQLREAQEERCGACGSWKGLRPWTSEEVYCRACLAIATVRLDPDGKTLLCTWTSPLRPPRD